MRNFICLMAILFPSLMLCQEKQIVGRILNEMNEPVAFATIFVKGTSLATKADVRGSFQLTVPAADADSLIITAIGYERKSLSINSSTAASLQVVLVRKITQLDEALVIAYGTTTRRFNTGNVTKVTAEEIQRQPVSNPLSALSGRVPGMIVTQTSGVPGALVNVQIRGRSTLDASLSRNDPLFIIDGVPFESGNLPSNQLSNAANSPVTTSNSPPTGISPLNGINPQDIESMEILKDADATAIYGSRGANGVILITTKKGKPGKTKFNLDMQTGFSSVTRTMEMLNTAQYVAMRKEAFANDGITPTNANAADLLLWDTTRYYNYKEILIGGQARFSHIQGTVSGGNSNTRFSLGGGYHRETTVYSNNFADTRGSFHFNIMHTPSSGKWSVQWSGIYSAGKNRIFRTDLTRYMQLPPHLELYTSSGKLNWQQEGVNFSALGYLNPLADRERKYSSLIENLSSNLLVNYELFKGISFRTSLGYNVYNSDEQSQSPKSSIAPENAALASSNFGFSKRANWIIEPQLEYKLSTGKSRLQVLLGTTFQQRTLNRIVVSGSGYTSDLLLTSLDAAATVTVSNYSEIYRYSALFGRVTYHHKEKYLINLSGRRDGSSRFGPGRQFANFGAAGLGWIFSAEPWMERQKLLSFGKLRTSFGVTGNDQIGDYKYLDLWTSTSNPYQGIPGLRPVSLFNPDYNWEKNNKWEAGLELGFFNDRLSAELSFYRHRSSNQLINYRLPNQAGFTSVVNNLPALVENKGWEIVLQSTNVQKKDFTWKTAFNISLPSNKLISFPGLAGSSYNSIYVEGMPLSVINKIKFLGVNTTTGIYDYEDLNGDLLYTAADRQLLGDLEPSWYGGLSNNIRWKQFIVELFFDFRKQWGSNILSQIGGQPPGFFINQPAIVMERWTKPGDITTIQKFTAVATSDAFRAANRLQASNAIYSEAGFARLKNLAVSYDLPPSVLNRLKISGARMGVQAQNLFTITDYMGNDPENQNFYQLPPLRTIVLSIQLSF